MVKESGLKRHTISCLVETMAGVTVGSVEGNFVAKVLEADCCVDNEALGSTDS